MKIVQFREALNNADEDRRTQGYHRSHEPRSDSESADNQHYAARAKEVIAFSVTRRGGKKFVGNKEDGTSARPQWRVFRNAFVAWLLRLSQASTVQRYLEKASKEAVDSEAVNRPIDSTPRTSIQAMLRFILSAPLVTAATDEEDRNHE